MGSFVSSGGVPFGIVVRRSLVAIRQTARARALANSEWRRAAFAHTSPVSRLVDRQAEISGFVTGQGYERAGLNTVLS